MSKWTVIAFVAGLVLGWGICALCVCAKQADEDMPHFLPPQDQPERD